MSDVDEMVAWLRREVEARLKLAREACHSTDGRWWRRTTDVGDGGPPEPVGPLYSGEPVIDDRDGEVLGGDFIVVYDEGAPSGAQFDHMEANDPRDVIARCEAELAMLDFCVKFAEADHWAAGRTLTILASGYRRRDGYQEAWKP